MDVDDEGTNKRQREEEDARAIEPFLSTDFLRLPPTALAKIVLDYGLTIAQMHALCTANATFFRICTQANVWKQAFIARFVRERDDKRDITKFEEWANEPLVRRWDAVAREWPLMRGFTHLAAEGVVVRIENVESPKLESTQLKCSVNFGWGDYGEGSDTITTIHITADDAMSIEEFHQKINALILPCGIPSFTPDHVGWSRDTLNGPIRRRVLLLVTKLLRTCLIAHMLETGWKSQYRAQPILPTNNCALCGAPATMQCAGCDKLYCSHECAHKE
jgi:hypothetical protein